MRCRCFALALRDHAAGPSLLVVIRVQNSNPLRIRFRIPAPALVVAACAVALVGCAPEFDHYGAYYSPSAGSHRSASAGTNARPKIALPDRALLEAAYDRRLPFVCANPDLVVDVGGRLYLCAGAIAALYEDLGGEVFWAGKPHASAYEAASKSAGGIRGAAIDRRRVLAIGDSLRTDLAGAAQAGIGGLFIGSGIHRHDSMSGTMLDPGKLARLFEPGSPPAVGAMPYLAW